MTYILLHFTYILHNIWSAVCDREYFLLIIIVVTVTTDSPMIRQEMAENLNALCCGKLVVNLTHECMRGHMLLLPDPEHPHVPLVLHHGLPERTVPGT